MADPAAGKFECPGGHLEQGESPRAAAIREWQEETGLPFVDGEWTGTWTSPDGIYQGFVYTIASEADLDIFDRQLGSDPDGDVTGTETIAWWDPSDLPGNPAVRSELLASIDDVMAALGVTPDPACCGAECCSGGCCDGSGGCTCGTNSAFFSPAAVAEDLVAAVEKRRDELAGIDRLMRTPPGPAKRQRVRHRTGSDDHLEHGITKAGGGSAPKARDWPGWRYDLRAAERWAPQVTAAVRAVLPASQLRQLTRDYLAGQSPDNAGTTGKRDLNDQATAWLRDRAPDLSAAIAALVAGILADAYLIGAVSAAAVTGGTEADAGDWQPGDTATAETVIADLGLGDDYQDTTGTQSGDRADEIAGGIYAALGRTLADGLQDGSEPEDLSGDLESTAGDTALTGGLLTTVITAISSLAASAWYALAGVQLLQWLTAADGRVCAVCQDNADAGAVPVNGSYPSGDAAPPTHPRCRCALIPADQ